MAAKTFTNPKPTAPLPAHEFTVDGWYADQDTTPGLEPPPGYEPRPWTEQFIAKGSLPPGTLIDLTGLVQVLPNGAQQYNLALITSFMRQALLNEEHARRWEAMIHDPNRLVEIETLGEIVLWLGEMLAGRPTSR